MQYLLFTIEIMSEPHKYPFGFTITQNPEEDVTTTPGFPPAHVHRNPFPPTIVLTDRPELYIFTAAAPPVHFPSASRRRPEGDLRSEQESN